jgi:hypothetical protein
MADSKITAFTGLATPADNDVLPIVDISDTTQAPSGTTKKITVADLIGTPDVSSVTGTLPVANGGTGATTSSQARTNLGVAIGSDVQAFDANTVKTTATQTLTNKTISSSNNTLTGVVTLTGTQEITGVKEFSTTPRFTFGTEAGGDIYYGLADGSMARLAKGTDGQVLSLASGLPVWGAGSTAGAQRVSLTKSAAQAISSASETAITWNTEDFDTDTMHDNSTNTSRITFTTAGVYMFGATIPWAGSSSGRRYCYIRKNATGAWLDYSEVIPPGAPAGTTQALHGVASFSASDYIEVYGYQSSGGSLDIYVDSSIKPRFWAYRIA